MNTLKGHFKPRNPTKYRGDPTKIIYRSSWELKLMSRLDIDPSVIEWASEEFSIPYRSPIDGKVHRYFPDFWVKKKSKDGTIEVVVIEVKPKSQTVPPVVKSRPTKRYVREAVTWGINSAKWAAAEEFCADRKWKFIKMTEQELGIKYG